MPAVSAPAKVLVTGANGYLGVWLVRALLEQGYHVRGTVRTTAKGDVLKRRVVDAGYKFEYIVVEDVLKVCPGLSGSLFDNALTPIIRMAPLTMPSVVWT